MSRIANAYLPFILTDRFGVATEVISGVCEAVIAGSCFEQCKRHVAKKYGDAVEEALHKFDLWVGRNKMFEATCDSPLIESMQRVP